MENNIEKNNEETVEEIKAENQSEPIEEITSEPANKKFPIWIIPLAISIVISIAMIIVLPGLFANQETGPVYKDYNVTVVDSVGQPMSNVIVNFTTPSGETKMKVTGKDGIATLPNSIEGDYKVKIEKGFSDAIIDASDFVLTKEITDLKVVVLDETKTMEIYGDIPDNSFAQTISIGNYNVPCADAKSYYFVFMAPKSGSYKISINSPVEGTTVGYYGNPMFVQSTHCEDGEYDGKTFDLIVQDHLTPYVIGINAIDKCEVNFVIERTGEAPFDPSYAPGQYVQAKGPFKKCNTTGKNLVDVDISLNNFNILLGDDGFYYTEDGKPVYIRLTSVTGHTRIDENLQEYPVLGGSLSHIAGLDGGDAVNNIGGVVYDENGNFVGKYFYNELLNTYLEYVDGTYGVVHMNAELAECIKLHGSSVGWFNPTSPGYLFDGVRVNDDISWLFLCMVEA